MSQEDTLQILKDLGNSATTREISELAKKKYPNRTLFKYVYTRLCQLEKNKRVERMGNKWIITEKFRYK